MDEWHPVAATGGRASTLSSNGRKGVAETMEQIGANHPLCPLSSLAEWPGQDVAEVGGGDWCNRCGWG